MVIFCFFVIFVFQSILKKLGVFLVPRKSIYCFTLNTLTEEIQIPDVCLVLKMPEKQAFDLSDFNIPKPDSI